MSTARSAGKLLTERRLTAEAGPTIFERGEDYVRYVHGLVVTGSSARASIQAERVYEVEMRWTAKRIDAYCSCPHVDQGFFCKHLVALGIAFIDAGGGRTRRPAPTEEAATSLAVRAASVTGDPEAAAAQLAHGRARQAAALTLPRRSRGRRGADHCAGGQRRFGRGRRVSEG